MERHQAVLRTLSVGLIGAAALVACGSDDDGAATSTEDDEAVTTEAAPEDSNEPVDDPLTTEEAPSDDDNAPPEDTAPSEDDDSDDPPATGEGTATLTLDNGESYEFGVLCSLEPQIAAGSEILFTATSYDDPSLDITQFGDEGTVTELATVSMYDASSFESLWGASSTYEPFGGGLELTLDGSTISGTGTFFAGDDPVAAPDGVSGEVVATC